ncbi:hypothetical protein ACFO5R_11630 [Halosolutus amylolyticus]|uniref:DUF1102 domain-containing protein n=1 Tax=Halosolutus amylolyticus TaxID=2932267 RepID=A0ABD5PPV2_9EURY|nr:hypothetical protein [Halosolutus amylolyticus]
MRLNRRNVLAGLGTIVAGGGAALGTGAFSSVEADRTVNISIADDNDSALLALDADGSSDLVTNDGGSGSDLKFNLDNLNDNATTKVEPAFTITNNGGQDVGVKVQAINTDDGDSVVGAFSFTSAANGHDLTSAPGTGEDGNLASNDPSESVTVNMSIDSDTGAPADANVIQIVADEQDYDVE